MKQREKPKVVEEEEEDEKDLELEGPMPVDALTTKGIASIDIKKLVEAGLNTVQSILFKPKKDLLQVKGLSENKVDKILEACNDLVKLTFTSAKDYFEIRK